MAHYRLRQRKSCAGEQLTSVASRPALWKAANRLKCHASRAVKARDATRGRLSGTPSAIEQWSRFSISFVLWDRQFKLSAECGAGEEANRGAALWEVKASAGARQRQSGRAEAGKKSLRCALRGPVSGGPARMLWCWLTRCDDGAGVRAVLRQQALRWWALALR